VLAFAVLPVFVWTAVDAYRGELLAIYGIGIALPVAVHVANVLPDLESDRAQGRRTAAVALGRERAVAVTMACQLAPLPLTALSLAWLEYEAAVLLPADLPWWRSRPSPGSCTGVDARVATRCGRSGALSSGR
jgi:4-hydroxybenzoate polyprenyltransferase